ncbi:MAG: bifunctional (p)ppGpp synthetase/guanosine-3',5'-bis(diphosphate) 3'-pyrophosphohydrolase [Myxococcales bacterium]|nr:bifunctional (p)ppGpp synthetase/guanosine-3',5'-bis(diphosphate) 3'-pyrophosphohydrolase [Myxococcales bacterium]
MNRPFDRDLYMRAWHFAATRHGSQRVKDSQVPYITHVGAVAMEVLATVAAEDVDDPDLAVACALLHDTIEDAGVDHSELVTEFGTAVATGVLALSKDKRLGSNEAMADSLRRIQPPLNQSSGASSGGKRQV